MLPSTIACVGLENIMLSEISPSERAIGFTSMWDIKLELKDTDSNVVVAREKGVASFCL